MQHLACVNPGGGPPGQRAAANYTLWVALKNKMEYYQGGRGDNKEERTLAKQVGQGGRCVRTRFLHCAVVVLLLVASGLV